MKETEIIFPHEAPIPEDKDGNVYTHSEVNDRSIIEAIDSELKEHGLELLVGDAGSWDHFFCIKERERVT